MNGNSPIVFDSSAVLAWISAEPGAVQVRNAILDVRHEIYIHSINLAEVWYQIHRASALENFLLQHPERVAANGTLDLTGLDLEDAQVFDASAGREAADQVVSDLQLARVKTFFDSGQLVWKRAALIKSKYRRVSLADCFGVALAIEMNAPFWTCDYHELAPLEKAKVAEIHFLR